MIKRKRLLNNFLIIISFIFLAYLSIAFMLKCHFIPGANDQMLHIRRLAEIEKSLCHLSFTQFGFNYLNGSAMMTLYPYFNLLPIALMSFLIKSKISAIYLSFSFYVLLTLLISYYSSLDISKSRWTSYIFAVIYSMSLMYFTYSFITYDLAEQAIITWLPLVIFGFIRLIKTNTKWVELSIGMSLIICTHVLSTIIVIMTLLIWFIFNIKEVNRKIIFSISKAIMVTTLATSIIWLPAITFIHDNPHFVRPFSLDFKKLITPLSFMVRDSVVGRRIEGLDVFAIATIFLGIMFFKHFNRGQKQMYIISIITILFCSKLFPWMLMPRTLIKFIEQFQFLTRFYLVPQLMLAYLFVIIIMKIPHTKRAKIGLLVVIALFTLFLQIKQQYIMITFDKSVKPISEKIINKSRLNQFSFNDFYYTTEFKEQKNGTYFNLPAVYNITNNKNYKLLENSNNDVMNYDYWPAKNLAPQTVSNRFSIANNYHTFKKNKDIKSKGLIYETDSSHIIHHTGFNRLTFNNPIHHNQAIMLPLFQYHNEHFEVYDNHKHMSTIKGANTINIKNAPYGKNHIKIIPRSSYGLRIGEIFTLIGCLFYILSLLKAVCRKDREKNAF